MELVLIIAGVVLAAVAMWYFRKARKSMKKE